MVSAQKATIPSPPTASGTTLKSTTIDGTPVLANAKGFTLYWFAQIGRAHV